jgi:enamine deaminase RidA (YjgF/YER057c/UK114 family)
MSANGAKERLAALGLEQPAAPGANYVAFVRAGDLVFVTGQLTQWNGERAALRRFRRGRRSLRGSLTNVVSAAGALRV